MAPFIQEVCCTANAFTFSFLFLLLACVCTKAEEHKIPKELTSHPNWKLLDLGDNCGISSTSRIIGGKDARIGQFPWMARIGFAYEAESKGRFFECGGSIISSRYVLTAAHCGTQFIGNGLKLVSVRLGEHDIDTDPDCEEEICANPVQDIPVEEEICHSDFNKETYESDICLLRLERPFEQNDFVSPICLPAFDFMMNNSFIKNEILYVAGWGYTIADTEGSGSKVLQVLSVPGVDSEICFMAYAHTYELSNQHICAGGTVGQDSCQGDSGGPLMKVCSVNTFPRYFLVGITSVGPVKCAEEPIPGVYTAVTKYWKWILDRIKA